jgi:RNA polymerase sigma factor (sigma-70 family)
MYGDMHRVDEMAPQPTPATLGVGHGLLETNEGDLVSVTAAESIGFGRDRNRMSEGFHLSDADLVARMRRGEDGAFQILAERYRSRLLWFCWQFLRSREDAEEAVQDVLVSAFRGLLADQREVNVRPWLYRIARNRCLGQLRRARPAGVQLREEHLAELAQTPLEAAVARERLSGIVLDAQALPASQRSALVLREIDGLAYQQIAQTMGTTIPAVKSLLSRARATLLECDRARDA